MVVETTGLADPAPILHTLMTDPLLASRYRLDGVVTTVDGVNGASTLDNHEEAVKQAAVADRLLLTKVDLADAPKLDDLKHRLQHLNPGAPSMSVADGEIDPNAILNAGLYNPETKTADVKRWLHEEAYEGSHDHGRVFDFHVVLHWSLALLRRRNVDDGVDHRDRSVQRERAAVERRAAWIARGRERCCRGRDDGPDHRAAAGGVDSRRGASVIMR